MLTQLDRENDAQQGLDPPINTVMGLDIQKIARQATKVAFGIAGGLLKTGTLRVTTTGGTYDPTTDQRTGGVEEYTLQGMFYQSREQQTRDNSANTGMMIFEAAAVIKAGLEAIPDEADQWVMDGITWSVERVDTDPATAIYMLSIVK